MERDAYLSFIRGDAERMAATISDRTQHVPVASCPGWDLRQLVRHTGDVHRWATEAIRTAARPGSPAVGAPADASLASWIRDGAEALVQALTDADPAAPTWHPFPFEQKVWVWSRRQAQETAMHRWDAEMAAVGSSSLDPVLACDGVEEYLELALPRVLSREKVAAPTSSLRVRCTDVAGDWLLVNDDGRCAVSTEPRPADAVITGPAESLLLVLMGRTQRSTIEIEGDASAADSWLSLPGF